MRLYLLRHGKAAPARPTLDDAERELTDKGRQQLEAIAQGLARLSIAPDLVVTSPLLRARDTATIMMEGLGLRATLQESELLLPLAPPAQTLPLLAEHATLDELMLVGHQPQLCGLAQLLCGLQQGQLLLKKGGLCLIDLPDPAQTGTLVWLVAPKLLVRLAR